MAKEVETQKGEVISQLLKEEYEVCLEFESALGTSLPKLLMLGCLLSGMSGYLIMSNSRLSLWGVTAVVVWLLLEVLPLQALLDSPGLATETHWYGCSTEGNEIPQHPPGPFPSPSEYLGSLQRFSPCFASRGWSSQDPPSLIQGGFAGLEIQLEEHYYCSVLSLPSVRSGSGERTQASASVLLAKSKNMTRRKQRNSLSTSHRGSLR